ncbi:Uu.00g053470.m01.CDS01 [Anthostomella pinea]|uniref:Uu.00g053470.m01.CDS01 n=1 Tax=Anthostomella pinea TaxID=933095 RepID=A0AAI8YM52_9PEZI|nr:Uu.00g053470.m01.CDS01 [Anthostomella pinea]
MFPCAFDRSSLSPVLDRVTVQFRANEQTSRVGGSRNYHILIVGSSTAAARQQQLPPLSVPPRLRVSTVFSGGNSTVTLAAYAPPNVLVSAYGLGATAPSTHHYAEQPSSPYTVDSGFGTAEFQLPHPKRQKLFDPAPAHSKKDGSDRPTKAADMTASDAVPAKSRRVRTGCLTCRERHLKCDEGLPDCKNCQKSHRECKRGVRLNFIDMTCKEPPYMPPTVEWAVQFQDESRLIASEYRGGLGRYAKFDTQAVTPPQESHLEATLRRQSQAIERAEQQPAVDDRSPAMIQTPQSVYYSDRSQTHPELAADAQIHSRKSSAASFMAPLGSSSSGGYASLLSDPFAPMKDVSSRESSHHGYKTSNVSTAASVNGLTGVGPPSTIRCGPGGNNTGTGNETGMMTPPNDKTGERDYLNSPEELRFMHVFVTEVGVWMDSLDKEKHFSRLMPYHALKCPMLLNALLACGVKHLTLTQQYSDDKALFYYDTATTQLLRNLQNPERNTDECAATAVVLNVYEIMSEKPTQRMSHIAGARALIRECGWNARSKGLGAACFWLNVGMELLSCLAFNWQTAWDPDTWGVDMDFTTDKETGSEEIWVHRIFYIVAKIANFRFSVPKFQEARPHDEEMRHNARNDEWKRLKSLCDEWNTACPRPMHPYGYLHPTQQTGPNKSLFPNVWLIKRAAIVGRLYYHTAECILAQVNPTSAKDSHESRSTQQYHAHQVCGIVAHTEDRGVASVSIRSLAIVAEILTDYAEQQEVVRTLERIDRETGWKLAGVVKSLKKIWGWGEMATTTGLTAQMLGGPGPGGVPVAAGAATPGMGVMNAMGMGKQQIDRMSMAHAMQTTQTTTPPQQVMPSAMAQQPQPGVQQQQPLAAPRPMRVNPLSFADFSLPNHPYQNWYEPPSRSNNYNSQSFL